MGKIKVFITGTSRGIGQSLATTLLENTNNEIEVEGLGRSCSITHVNYKHVICDLSEPKVSNQIDFQCDGDFQLLVLINNAGTTGEIGYLGNLNDESINQTIQLNLSSAVVLTNRFLNQTKDFTGHRIIINISSGAGKHPYDGWAVYCASKAGIDMFSEVLKSELDEKNDLKTKVFSISPGVVETQMQTQIRSADKTQFSRISKFIELHEKGNLKSPELVAIQIQDIILNPERYNEVVLRLKG